jgi:transcriptional regulator with XRE-family HTH domain
LTELYVEFGSRLRQARKRARLTQGALAHQVGLSRTSITNIELGRQQVLLHNFIALANAVGQEPATMLPAGRPDTLLRSRLRLNDREHQWFDRIRSHASKENNGPG